MTFKTAKKFKRLPSDWNIVKNNGIIIVPSIKSQTKWAWYIYGQENSPQEYCLFQKFKKQ